MSKLFIVSIQGQELVTVDGYQEPHGQYYNRSYIKVLNMESGKKEDWKLGCFTQPKNQIHEDNEINNIKKLGLNCYYINPWNDKNNNKDALNLVKKMTNIYNDYEEDNGTIISGVFDGYVIIGEIEKDIVYNMYK